MTPVSKGPRIGARRAVIVALAGVVAGVGLFLMVLVLAESEGVEVNLGDDRFEAGDSERTADSIEADGPILYSDVGGGERDIYLQHVEADPERGWIAFEAHQPDASRDCFLEWEEDDEHFVDPCDGTVFPPDGEGLEHFPVEVDEDGRLIIDLNATARSTSTTAPSASAQ